MLVAVLPGCFTTPVFEVAPRALRLELDGDFGASTSGGASANSSVDSLGLDDEDWVFNMRGDVETGPWHLTIDGFSTSVDGDGSLDGPLSIGDLDLDIGDDVSSKLEFGYARALITVDVVPSETFDLGIGGGAAYGDIDAEIEEQTTGLSESVDDSVVIPVAAGRARVRLGRFSVGATVSGILFDISDVDASYFDVDGSAKMRLFGKAGLEGMIEVGYRYIAIDGDFDDGDTEVDLDVDYSGPYVGLRLSF